MIHFTKMHGIGNDYVYLDGFRELVENPAQLAVQMADRHFGVGADGLILILPPSDRLPADLRMRIFNADGSEAEMCGNGIRCVAKYAHDHGLTEAKPIRVETGAGVLAVDYTTDSRGKLQTATVNMGVPAFEAVEIPLRGIDGRAVERDLFDDLLDAADEEIRAIRPDLEAAGVERTASAVSMGNPHLVLFARAPDALDLSEVGPVLERAATFPNRTNVHITRLDGPSEVTMRTWERGAGMTLACGTGACAVCAAATAGGRTGPSVLVHLPGGDLRLEWAEDDHVYMTGPATEVFRGEWLLDATASELA